MPQPDNASIEITAAAARRIRDSAARDGRARALLRLWVEGGGCAGFRYRFELADAPAGDDVLFEQDDVTVAVDPVSLPLLSGARLEEADDPLGSGLVVNNPSATSGCGCGDSFAA